MIWHFPVFASILKILLGSPCTWNCFLPLFKTHYTYLEHRSVAGNLVVVIFVEIMVTVQNHLRPFVDRCDRLTSTSGDRQIVLRYLESLLLVVVLISTSSGRYRYTSLTCLPVVIWGYFYDLGGLRKSQFTGFLNTIFVAQPWWALQNAGDKRF